MGVGALSCHRGRGGEWSVHIEVLVPLLIILWEITWTDAKLIEPNRKRTNCPGLPLRVKLPITISSWFCQPMVTAGLLLPGRKRLLGITASWASSGYIHTSGKHNQCSCQALLYQSLVFSGDSMEDSRDLGKKNVYETPGSACSSSYPGWTYPRPFSLPSH